MYFCRNSREQDETPEERKKRKRKEKARKKKLDAANKVASVVIDDANNHAPERHFE